MRMVPSIRLFFCPLMRMPHANWLPSLHEAALPTAYSQFFDMIALVKMPFFCRSSASRHQGVAQLVRKLLSPATRIGHGQCSVTRADREESESWQ